MSELTRKEIQAVVKPKLAHAIKRGDYELFKSVLAAAGIAPGSERYRSLESQFWRAVSERRKKAEQSC